MITETVTRLRAAGRDRNGDPTGDPSEVNIEGCVIWPTGSSEQTFQQDTVTSDYQVLMPPGTDVLPTDQIRWDGVVYDVDGEPGRYRNPFTGTDPGVLVTIRRAA